MKFKIYNPDLTSEERTFLDADYSSGMSLTVRDNGGFTDNWFVVIGEPGQEQTETKRISSTSTNTTITIPSACKFAHPKSTPIYLSRWDQWAVERSSSSSSGFATISTSPLNIEWDEHDLTTLVEDDTGTTGHYYKWRPYNSYLNTYGTYSDVLAGTGLAKDQVGYLITQVKRSPLSKEIDDDVIIEFFNDFQDLVYEEVPEAWWFTKQGASVSTVAGDYDYAISSNWEDFKAMKFMLYNYVNGSTSVTYPLTWSPPAEFYNLKMDANETDDDYVKYWSLLPPDGTSARGYIGLHPTPKTTACYLKPVYFFELDQLDSFGDTVYIPKTKGYVDYALYRIADEIKLDTANADKFLNRVKGSIIALKRLTNRQLGQKEFTRFRGHRGWSRMFGEQTGMSSTQARELYW
jgi:hypothetical protein